MPSGKGVRQVEPTRPTKEGKQSFERAPMGGDDDDEGRPSSERKALFLFVADDHTSTEQQIELSADLHKYAGGILWLEFFYEAQLAGVRDVLASDSDDEDAVFDAVLEGVSINGWSREYNQSLVDLLRMASKLNMAIHALDDPEWSRDAFEAKYGKFRGGLKYLANRASCVDDGVAATSRWVRKVMRVYEQRGREGPVIVLGGAEHGPVMIKLMADKYEVPMSFMYEKFGEVKQRAHRKMSIQFEEAIMHRKADEEDEDDDAGKLQEVLQFFLGEALQVDLDKLRVLAARRYPMLSSRDPLPVVRGPGSMSARSPRPPSARLM